MKPVTIVGSLYLGNKKMIRKQKSQITKTDRILKAWFCINCINVPKEEQKPVGF